MSTSIARSVRPASSEASLASTAHRAQPNPEKQRLPGCCLSPWSHTGLDALRESIAVPEGSGARLEHAHSLIEFGSAIRRPWQRSPAGWSWRTPVVPRPWLTGVPGAACHRCSSTTDGTVGVEALTSSELRVATRGTTRHDHA